MKPLLLALIFPATIIFLASQTMKEDGVQKDSSFELHHVVRKPKDNTKPAPLLLLLHGYGSNEQDLFSIANKIPDNWFVVSVRAPLEISSNQFKWYDVKMVDKKITANSEDLENSRIALLAFIDKIGGTHKVDKNEVVVAGFSQGANMALSLVLTQPEKVLAAGCFSGRFMEEYKPQMNRKDFLQSKWVFIAHGTKDQMLPITYAEESAAILKELGLVITLSTDEVAHSISNKHLADFIRWLNEL